MKTHQSKIEKLIAELCPNGVEWKPLGAIVNNVTAPMKLKKEAYREIGVIPIIDQGASFITGYTEEDVKALPADEYIIFGDHSEHIKYIDFAFVQGADGLKILKPKSESARYIYHAFQNFYQKELNYKRHWSKAKDTLIPIPPLTIQKEIVCILDTFTELTTELTTRKKQYSYYRDQLLTFAEGEVAWVPLGEIFNLKNGYTPSKSEKDFWQNGSIPWFRMDDIRKNGQILDDSLQKISKRAVKGGKLFPADSIIIATSATIGEHALITVPYLANQRFTNLSLKEKYVAKFEIKFLFYYCFLLGKWCKKNTTMSSFASVDMDGFRKFKIPIPHPDDPKKSLAEQARIVSILDKFDTLTHSISEGLPREIALRQKQYEYYRDLLLNFPKSEVI